MSSFLNPNSDWRYLGNVEGYNAKIFQLYEFYKMSRDFKYVELCD